MEELECGKREDVRNRNYCLFAHRMKEINCHCHN